MKTKIIIFISIILFFASCQSQTSKAVQTIDVNTYSEKLKTTYNPQLLDVRTPEEFSVDQIESAVNINWNGDDFEKKVASYDKSKPIFVYCKVGGRSAKAATKLAELGFKEIYNLEGGIMKWNITYNAKTSDKIIGICNQEYNELIKSDKKVMVNFFAEWCAPCKKMGPYIIKMQSDLKDRVAIVRLDADKNKTIVDELKLDGLPVIILYENGKETWRNVGYISEENLKKHL